MTSFPEIDFSIIIINYNLSKEIDNCLVSFKEVAKTINNFSYEIIIVDNNSPERDLVNIESKFKSEKITFHYLDENLGFGKGCNYGFKFARGKYVCFLNPDTIIIEDIFTPILKLYSEDKSVGIIGPKQQIRKPFFDFSAGFFPNMFFEVFALFGLNVFLEGFIIHWLTKINDKNIFNVDWILGACLFIRADIFKEINGFDNDYFMFFEEVDLCKRVTNKNYKIIYLPKLSMHHIGSVSGKKNYTLYTIRTYTSKFLFVSKNYKSIHKVIMKILLYLQIFSQIIIWSILFLANPNKSKQKISAFVQILKNGFKNKAS